jgi:hypothetical protein
MSSTPYAPVTCLDAATSIGAADATIVPLDFRFAGENNYAMNYVGTLASVGAADSVRIQVSPDWKAETALGAMWVTVETITTTAFGGSINAPWAAVRFIKPGDQTAKVVGLAGGRNRSKPAIVG